VGTIIFLHPEMLSRSEYSFLQFDLPMALPVDLSGRIDRCMDEPITQT